MSGPSLLWPLKPQDVSDENESFIHVLEFCALHFHPYSMSHLDIWPEAGEPGYRDALAKWIAEFFYFDTKVEGSKYVTGGRGKFSAYAINHPSWHLTDSRHSSFADLLSMLHELVYEHYRHLDIKHLNQYLGYTDLPTATAMTIFSQASLSDVAEAEAIRQHDVAMFKDESPKLPKKPNKDYFHLPFSVSVPVEKPTTPDPLVTHECMYKFLYKAVYEEDNWPKDETLDQFENLPGIGLVYDKWTSYSFTSNSSITWSKASQEYHEAREDCDPPAKRQKPSLGEDFDELQDPTDADDSHTHKIVR